MSLQKGKHLFGELNDVRVSFVEKGITSERAEFLRDLLEHNGFEVIIGEDKRKSEEDPQTYTLGVTDMTFNPVIAVYQRRLLTRDGRKVTPEYWNQESEETDPNYWNFPRQRE